MYVGHDASGNHVVHRKPRATCLLHDVVDHLSFAESVKERCNGSHVHRQRSPPELVRCKPCEFIHDYADILRTLWNLNLHSLLDNQRTGMIVYMRREVIHSRCDINELPVSETFAHLFNAAMNVTQMRLDFFYSLAIEGNDKV